MPMISEVLLFNQKDSNTLLLTSSHTHTHDRYIYILYNDSFSDIEGKYAYGACDVEWQGSSPSAEPEQGCRSLLSLHLLVYSAEGALPCYSEPTIFLYSALVWLFLPPILA